jgi:hypothetical protein
MIAAARNRVWLGASVIVVPLGMIKSSPTENESSCYSIHC